MIRVQRGTASKPPGFDARSSAWLAEYHALRAAKKVKSVTEYWNKIRSKIRPDAEALQRVFREKCAYCEARMTHVSRPHVEHYRPKSHQQFEELAFSWTNWLLSCGRCNEAKWSHFPDCAGMPCLIDPTSEQPGAHISFVEHRIVGLSDRGERTIGMLGLSRVPLVEERQQWLLQTNVLLLLATLSPPVPEARTLLVWSLQDDAPFAAMTRLHLQAKAPLLAVPETPHPTITVDNPREGIRELIATNAHRLKELR